MTLTIDVLIDQVQGLEQERDALHERVARLEAERDEADDTCNRRLHDLTRLRAVLEKHGGHVGACRQMRCRSDWRCACGLEEALTPPAVGEDLHGGVYCGRSGSNW